jgi:acetyltransferase-like isoleucine patch superfamily enzyme
MNYKKIIKEILPESISNLLIAARNLTRKKDYFIDKTAILKNRKLIEIGNKSEIKEYVIIQASLNKIIIGSHTQINPFTVIYGHSEINIGNNVMIAPHCTIAAGNHDYKQLQKPIRFASTLTKGPIIIKNDVWIGANCTITDGVTINEGAVIAANSLVNKDVMPYAIVGGVPISIISNRKSQKEKN